MASTKLEYQSLSEFIYKEISSGILSGKYKPGSKLVENSFQEKYGVSKSPIREAFQMLINDQLVERKARRGCFVKELDIERIHNIYEIRMILEGYATGKTYESLEDKQLEKLKKLYALMEKDAQRNDSKSYFEHHDKFQGFFSEECGNDSLAEVCQKLRLQNRWYNMQFSELDLVKDLHTHDNIIEHFEKHDITASEAQLMMRDHIKIGLDNFNRYAESVKTP